MPESLSSVDPVFWFMGLGLLSVFISRFGTHLVMPYWIASALRWGGWLLVFFAVLQYLEIFDFLNLIPI